MQLATPKFTIILVWLVVLGLTAYLVESAQPDPPASGITTVGSLRIATAEDCAGVVAFSATLGTNNDARLIFSQTLVNKGVGYVAETGIFTTHCPGLYQFSFAGYGSSDLKLTLKRKANKSENWRPITSVGPGGGGANIVLFDAEIGDQFAVFVDAGKATEGMTYTGYRVSKK
ncbi:uncharacterized protein LOC107044893 isoform X2 [Diachasma alloeum]|uniref:uncharacterized protein LOC107044893 isoform X2 n=1 Tax=Diachasma alloeum TaxID=454923 RepID=UPI000738388C|nr:uncharacterized protein LOC107044893 isoform X2 [Diachasma alloeum]